jgi:hypothetical protein
MESQAAAQKALLREGFDRLDRVPVGSAGRDSTSASLGISPRLAHSPNLGGGLYRHFRKPSLVGMLQYMVGFRCGPCLLLIAETLATLLTQMNAEEEQRERPFGKAFASYRRRNWRPSVCPQRKGGDCPGAWKNAAGMGHEGPCRREHPAKPDAVLTRKRSIYWRGRGGQGRRAFRSGTPGPRQQAPIRITRPSGSNAA